MRVQLNGEILDDNWGLLFEFFDIPCAYPRKVRQAIEDNPAGEDLVVEINSGGGDVVAGFEIYSVLRGANCRTVAEVQSLAGSAASVVMTGCDEVTASPVAQVMIHLPWTRTEGDRYEHQRTIGALDSITDSILNAYVSKAGPKSTRSELRGLMKASTWMTAPEAKGLGLVDRIIGEEDMDPTLVLNCCGSGHGIRSLGGGLTDRKALLDRYRDAVARGEAPEVPALGIFRDDDWELGPETLRKGSETPEDAAEAQRGPNWARDPIEMKVVIEGDEDIAEALAVLELEKIRFGGN